MKEKEPKIASFRNATTIYMGHANGQDGEWDLFYSVHFEDRSAERKCSVEKAGIILGTIFEDAIFADKVSEDIVLSRASRRQSYEVVYYDYDLRIRAFKKLYEQVMDASCLPCED